MRMARVDVMVTVRMRFHNDGERGAGGCSRSGGGADVQ